MRTCFFFASLVGICSVAAPASAADEARDLCLVHWVGYVELVKSMTGDGQATKNPDFDVQLARTPREALVSMCVPGMQTATRSCTTPACREERARREVIRLERRFCAEHALDANQRAACDYELAVLDGDKAKAKRLERAAEAHDLLEAGRRNVKRLLDASGAYFDQPYDDHGVERRRATSLPSVGPTPSGSACATKDHRFAPDPARWTAPTWSSLNFSVEDPDVFAYTYKGMGSGEKTRVVVTAVADPRCDGHKVYLSGRASAKKVNGEVELVVDGPIVETTTPPK